jgi:hypothetical protein
MKGLIFFAMLLAIALVIWVTSEKDGFQDLQLPSAYDDRTPLGASPSLNIPVTRPPQRSFTQNAVQPFAPPSTALLAPPPGQIASVNTRPAEDPALQKASPRRIQSVFESMNGFFERSEAGLQKLGDPSVQLPLTTARSDKNRLKDELAVLVRNPGLESSLTEEDLSGIEANLAYLQRKWNMSVNAESGMPPEPEGFQNNSRWSIFGWLFGEKEGFQTVRYECPTTLTSEGGRYILFGTQCVEQCPEGYTKTAITCKNSKTNAEYMFDTIAAKEVTTTTTSTTPTPAAAPMTTPTPAAAPMTTPTPAAAPMTTPTPAAAPMTTPTPDAAPMTTVSGTYKCPTSLTPQGGRYMLSDTECIEQCPEGYIQSSISCKNTMSNAEYIFSIIPATYEPNVTPKETEMVSAEMLSATRPATAATATAATATPATTPATAAAAATTPAAAAAATTATSSSSSDLTLSDLKDLSFKLQYEILRLESSGST